MVENIKINSFKMTKQQMKKLQLVKNGDIGYYSKIYKLNETECIKTYNNPNQTSHIFAMPKLNDFTKYDFEYATMPISLLILDNKFSGYKLKFINGRILELMDLNTNYDSFIKMVSNLLHGLDEISYNKIYIDDIHDRNIMYDKINKKLILIDIDKWNYSYGRDVEKENFDQVVKEIIKFLYKALPWDLEFYYKIPPLNIKDDYIDYFSNTKYVIEKKENIKIKTLCDMRKYQEKQKFLI